MSLDNLESVSLPLDLGEFDEIVDVRTPLEFTEDHLPGAVNLPVLDDRQRVAVGTLYKSRPFEARRLGAALVSEAVAGYLHNELATRRRNWRPLLYCWRGGLRSKSFATILRSIGWRARVLEGGYKAWRRFVRNELDRLAGESGLRFHVLAGLTGTGKTRLLGALRDAGAQVVDLEGLANHRGSLLGACGEQPAQKRFETLLHGALRGLDPGRPVFCEAESNRIGHVYVPPSLWKSFAQATVIELALPRPERVKLLLDDYAHFLDDSGHLAGLLDELRPLRGHLQVDAWQAQISTRAWPEFVASILEHHYDRCYRRPGSRDSVYSAPSRRLEITDASHQSYRAAARDLMAWTESPASK